MSDANANWIRDRTGYDLNRFNWAGPPALENQPIGVTAFTSVTLSGTQVDDWNLQQNEFSFGSQAAVRIDLSANTTITGMIPSIGGEIKTLVNVSSSYNITIANQSVSSSTSNRFSIAGDIDISPGNSAQFWYDPVALSWRLLSLRGGVHSALPLLMSGGAAPLTLGVGGWLEVPANATITGWKFMSLETCTVQMDVWKAPFGSFPPTIANSICGGNLPTITNSKSNSDTTLTGWTLNITAGDIVLFNLSASDGRAIHLMISLDVTRTQ